LLPRGAYVINTARGPCIDLNALLPALDSGQVSFAALGHLGARADRGRPYPPASADLLNAHVAFYSVESFQEMRSKGALEARRMVLGGLVRIPVNRYCLVQSRAVLAPES